MGKQQKTNDQYKPFNESLREKCPFTFKEFVGWMQDKYGKDSVEYSSYHVVKFEGQIGYYMKFLKEMKQIDTICIPTMGSNAREFMNFFMACEMQPDLIETDDKSYDQGA